jgi:5-formyltetrahydrofolate cyclo-ligase
MPGDAERREAGQRLADVGLGFCQSAPDAVVSGYHPVRGEIDCLPLLAALASQGRTLALPIAREDGLLDFMTWSPGAELRPGRFNIPCPVGGALVEPGVLLIPLLAFDKRGFRLGYGGGCYDRTLTVLRAQGAVAAVGLAYDFQEALALPSEPHDQRLDWVVTPAGPRRLGV